MQQAVYSPNVLNALICGTTLGEVVEVIELTPINKLLSVNKKQEYPEVY